MDTVLQSAAYDYNGRVSEDIRQAAIRCYNDYKSDREPFVARMRDNERYYRSFYDKMAHTEMTRMRCSTPLLFSCIENAAADASATACCERASASDMVFMASRDNVYTSFGLMLPGAFVPMYCQSKERVS